MRAILAFFLSVVATNCAVAQFTVGNLVVFQSGDGSATLDSSATPAFLRQYTTMGSFVNTTSSGGGVTRFTIGGSITSEGFLNRSLDGTQLVFGGYDAAVGLATVSQTSSTSVPRVVDAVNSSGVISTIGSSTSSFSGTNIRSVFSNGTTTWAVGGSSGIVTIPGDTAVSVNSSNNRVINSFNGNLYFSTQAGTKGIWQVGSSGLPTSSVASQIIIDTSGGSSAAFAFSPTGNVCYVADERTVANGGGVQKWTFSGNSWTLAGTFAASGTNGARGLTVDFSGTNPILYATTTETNANRIVSIVDTRNFSSLMTTLATAPTNTAFRGIAFAPVPEPFSILGIAAAGLVATRVVRRRKIA